MKYPSNVAAARKFKQFRRVDTNTEMININKAKTSKTHLRKNQKTKTKEAPRKRLKKVRQI